MPPPGQDKRRQIVEIALQRVLDREKDRLAIGSLGDLRRIYEGELAANRAEIEAQDDMVADRTREVLAQLTSNLLRCIGCDGPIPCARRLSRRYCSDRCRQRAHRRPAWTAQPPPAAAIALTFGVKAQGPLGLAGQQLVVFGSNAQRSEEFSLCCLAATARSGLGP